MNRWVGGMAAIGAFIFLGTAWAVETKPLVHPAIGNAEKLKQPSRILLNTHLNQEAGRKPETFRGRDRALAKMNERLGFQENIQSLKNPVAYKARQPELKMPNPNQRAQ